MKHLKNFSESKRTIKDMDTDRLIKKSEDELNGIEDELKEDSLDKGYIEILNQQLDAYKTHISRLKEIKKRQEND